MRPGIARREIAPAPTDPSSDHLATHPPREPCANTFSVALTPHQFDQQRVAGPCRTVLEKDRGSPLDADENVYVPISIDVPRRVH